MRIVFLSTGHPVIDKYPEGGGIQYEIRGLAERLASGGNEIHVIARRLSSGMTDLPRNLVYHRINAPGSDEVLSVLNFGRLATHLVASIEPDLLYLSERFSAMFPARLRVPKVFALHNPDGIRPYWRFAATYNPINFVLFPFKNQAEEAIMRGCDRVIVPTESWLEYLFRINLLNGYTIPHGLRLEEFRDAGDSGFVLFAGRLNRIKGLDLLIRALAEAEGKGGSEFDLIVAGAGPQSNDLRLLARKLGIKARVKFLGHVPRETLLRLYSTCTALVVPSRWETFGIVAAEGMASGKPVIASNVRGPGDYIRHGQNGLLFPSGDVETLAKTLTSVVEDSTLRHRLGTQARHFAVRTFDFEQIATAHSQLYATITTNRS